MSRWVPVETGMYEKVARSYDRGMASVPVSAARDQLPAVLAQSATEAVTLLRHGRPVAVVVSPERYEELLEAEEELEDVEAFDAAMAEAGDAIPWEQVKVDLGWT